MGITATVIMATVEATDVPVCVPKLWHINKTIGLKTNILLAFITTYKHTVAKATVKPTLKQAKVRNA